MTPAGLAHSTDHGHALLAAAQRLVEVACTEEVEARITTAMKNLHDACEAFGETLWSKPIEGWDVQDVLANIKPRHDAYIAACRHMDATLAEGIF